MPRPNGVVGVMVTSPTRRTHITFSAVTNLTLCLPWLTAAQKKLDMFAKPCAAASVATDQSRRVSLTTPSKSLLVRTPTTPPSIAPIIMGKNAHAISSLL